MKNRLNETIEIIEVRKTNYFVGIKQWNVVANVETNLYTFGFSPDGVCQEVMKKTPLGFEVLPNGARYETLPDELNIYLSKDILNLIRN